MDYEHCWSYARSQPDYRLAWSDLVADAQLILSTVTAAGIRLAGPAGQRTPIADVNSGIVVNGDADYDEHAQTFLLRPPAHRTHRHLHDDPVAVVDSCTTARRPYDVAVTTILLHFALTLPGTFTILSDGDWNTEWAYGAEKVSTTATSARLSARTLEADLFGNSPTRRPFA
jgi:hypothetical protein